MAFRVVRRVPGWGPWAARNYTSDAAFPAGFRVPELPEVEAVARDVRRALRRSTIVDTIVRRWDVVTGASRQSERLLIGSRVDEVVRRGKQLALIGLDGSVLVVQLGMTGEFGVVPASSPVMAHTHIIWRLDRSRDLHFVDPRRFGGVTWLKDRAALEDRWSRLGPDALSLQSGWSDAFADSRRAIKAALLDQHHDFLSHGAHREKGDDDQKTLFSHINDSFYRHRTLLRSGLVSTLSDESACP